MKKDNAILTPAQAAEELSLNLETVRSLMRRGLLPAAKVGGSWRTTRRALYGYLENQMGLESRFPTQRRKDNGRRVLQVQRRGPTVDNCKINYDKRTVDEKRYCLERFYKMVGDVEVTEIDPPTILEFINKRAKSQSNNAANKDRKNLKAFYSWIQSDAGCEGS